MNNRANKEKKNNNKNNNTYYRPWSIITDMTGMENRCMAIKKFSLFHLKTSTLNNWCIFFHARFWRIFIIIQLKEVNFHVFQIRYWYWKDEKYWIQVLTLFPSFPFVKLSNNENKGLLSGHVGGSWTLFFYTMRGIAALLSSSSSVCGVCWCRNGDCPFRVHTETETQRKVLGGERPESSLSHCLSFALFFLSISLSSVDLPCLW